MQLNTETILVLGGCRSGKSSHALALAEMATEKNRLYIATCVPYDDEMQDRVSRHQDERDHTWKTIETPVNIADAILENSRHSGVILIDCLTLWVTNLLMADKSEDEILDAVTIVQSALAKAECPVIFVSNEVGAGIVPENSLARRFRDIAGFVNQKIAKSADIVFFTAAGIPIKIKGS